VEGRQVPHTLLVRHGDTIFAQLKLESVELAVK
jgi:hypothetical protein